ncbi:MAG: flagellar biosynthetic protein FliO [Thermoanaerobacteraceae bacterium]|nr:flagellar biosynthetic protein FliO [Thermoanaerobacteraceae bacterium]
MNDGELFWAVIRLVIALPLVAFLAYLAVRYGLGRRLVQTRGRHMRVIEQVPLGLKATLTLVQVGRRYYLLAQQEGGVTLLQEFDHLPEVIPLPGETPEGGLRPLPFQEELAAAMLRLKERFNRGKGEAPGRAPGTTFTIKTIRDEQQDEHTQEKD